MTMTGSAEAERLPSQNVTANLFDLLGVNPESGRSFADAEDKPGAPPVALISHSLWERRFSSSPGVLGPTITLDSQSYFIICGMPPRVAILPQSRGFFLPVVR